MIQMRLHALRYFAKTQCVTRKIELYSYCLNHELNINKRGCFSENNKLFVLEKIFLINQICNI